MTKNSCKKGVRPDLKIPFGPVIFSSNFNDEINKMNERARKYFSEKKRK